MMPEISLNVLDVAENCVRADAGEVVIDITASLPDNTLTITITDDGHGMDEETLQRVTDPFYTTRTTRKVGLGVPFFKQAAEMTGGSFTIHSSTGENAGTTISAVFVLDHIDRMPLGDMPATMHTLITMHETIRWQYRFAILSHGEEDAISFALDTKEMKALLGDVPFTEPEVSTYLMEFLRDNTDEVLDSAGVSAL